MKYSYTILFFLFFKFCLGQIGINTQDSILLIQQPYSFCCNAGPSTGPQYTYYQNNFFINGDSTVNGKSYKKLYWSHLGHASASIISPVNYSQFVFKSLLRTDSNKVYKYTGSFDSLIINYNMTVGDSLIFNGHNVKLRLQSIDSVYLSGRYLKRLNFQQGIKWVKGIGDVAYGASYTYDYYFLHPTIVTYPPPGFTISNGSNFICYSEKGENIIGTLCQNNTTTIHETNEEVNIMIYPNPSSQILHIKHKTDIEIETCLLYTLSGKRLELVEKTKGEYDISNLAKGMYFLQIKSSKATIIKKIIIEH